MVAYRAITYTFDGSTDLQPAVQLRPGDVMADIRLARLNGRPLGADRRDQPQPEASMRPPTADQRPQVGAGVDGGAVVAWQEPDQTGAARIWMRRIFGTTPGQILQASPSDWEGKPISADADAFSLAVTPLTRGPGRHPRRRQRRGRPSPAACSSTRCRRASRPRPTS